MSMLVATTKNASKPEHITYADMEVLDTESKGDKVFAVHRSYNPLFDCYMVSEYATGYILTCFSVQGTDSEDAEREAMINRFKVIVDELDLDSLDNQLKSIPVVNDVPECEEAT